MNYDEECSGSSPSWMRRILERYCLCFSTAVRCFNRDCNSWTKKWWKFLFRCWDILYDFQLKIVPARKHLGQEYRKQCPVRNPMQHFIFLLFFISQNSCVESWRVPKWKNGQRTLVVFLSMLQPQRIKEFSFLISHLYRLSYIRKYLSKPGLNSGVTRVAELSQLSHACHHRLLLWT